MWVSITIRDTKNSPINITTLNQVKLFAQSKACTGWNTSSEQIAIATKCSRVYMIALSRMEPPCGSERVNIISRNLHAWVIFDERKKTQPTVIIAKVVLICRGQGRKE